MIATQPVLRLGIRLASAYRFGTLSADATARAPLTRSAARLRPDSSVESADEHDQTNGIAGLSSATAAKVSIVRAKDARHRR
jgi:hypothetical protein